MSSATSTSASPPSDSPGAFQPWQFFLLAGMLAATASVLVATGQSAAAIIFLSITVVSASFVGLAVYRSLAPLVLPESAPAPTLLGGRTRAGLEREKTLALRALKELEFDYAMKKIAQPDYEEMNARLRARALRLMRQLEAGEGYRAEIERELARRLGQPAAPADPGTSPPTASAPTVPASAPAAADNRACTCGTTNDPDARFCKSCGSRLGTAAGSAR